MKTAMIACSFSLVACAAHQRLQATSRNMMLQEKSPGLFVGHTDEGETVIAASHYDAMNGLAVLDTDLGLTKRKDGGSEMLCRRELPTGSHVPHWACRYVEDVAAERQFTLNLLQAPAFAPNGNSGGGMSGSLGAGSVSKTQQR